MLSLQLGIGYTMIAPKIEFAKKLASFQLNDTDTALFMATILLTPGCMTSLGNVFGLYPYHWS